MWKFLFALALLISPWAQAQNTLELLGAVGVDQDLDPFADESNEAFTGTVRFGYGHEITPYFDARADLSVQVLTTDEPQSMVALAALAEAHLDTWISPYGATGLEYAHRRARLDDTYDSGDDEYAVRRNRLGLPVEVGGVVRWASGLRIRLGIRGVFDLVTSTTVDGEDGRNEPALDLAPGLVHLDIFLGGGWTF